MKKEGEFNIAINLRKQGLSYSEILQKVSVAKSTLSLWFHKEHNVSQPVGFSNSDPAMIQLFNKWLLEICVVAPKDIYFELYIHQTASTEAARKFWASTLQLPDDYPFLVRYKKGNIKSYRKNKGEQYHGLIRINVRRSADLGRKIMGWAEGVYRQVNYSGVV